MLRTGDDASDKANAIFRWITEGFKAALESGYVHKVRACVAWLAPPWKRCFFSFR